MLPPRENPLAALLLGATSAGTDYLQQQRQHKQRLSELMTQEGLRTQRDLLKQKQTSDLSQSNNEEMIKNLIERGVDPNLANIYARAPTGAQTSIINYVIDQEQRGLLKPGTSDALRGIQTEVSEDIDERKGDEDIDEEISIQKSDLPPLPKSYLKPSEEYQLNKDREKINTPLYTKISDKYQSLKKEKLAFDELLNLEDRGNLPTGLGKWNVNWKTGELRIPALANADTQKFVKIINDFTTKAKDSYGARVTNFDLSQFMKRLPTLANSSEGRRAIISYMKKINELDSLQEKVMMEVYNHYGIDKINYQQARQRADKIIRKKEKTLIQEAKQIENKLENISDKNRKEFKEKLGTAPKGFAYMTTREGDIVKVPNEDVNKAIKEEDYELL